MALLSTPALVRDLMTVGVPSCAPDTPMTDIAGLLLQEALEGVVVLNSEGHAVGVVTQDELVRCLGRDDIDTLTAEDVMRDELPQVPPEIPLNAAAQIMQDMGVRLLYVMHNAGGRGYPAAVISYRHLLRQLSAATEDDLGDLGIKAERQSPLETFIQKRDEARRRALSREE